MSPQRHLKEGLIKKDVILSYLIILFIKLSHSFFSDVKIQRFFISSRFFFRQKHYDKEISILFAQSLWNRDIRTPQADFQVPAPGPPPPTYPTRILTKHLILKVRPACKLSPCTECLIIMCNRGRYKGCPRLSRCAPRLPDTNLNKTLELQVLHAWKTVTHTNTITCIRGDIRGVKDFQVSCPTPSYPNLNKTLELQVLHAWKTVPHTE